MNTLHTLKTNLQNALNPAVAYAAEFLRGIWQCVQVEREVRIRLMTEQ